ncbi:MAG: hypothetical protein REH79_00905 [Spiroplasma sp.]|nr:hypothetical protein [Spiroplasma sp.]
MYKYLSALTALTLSTSTILSVNASINDNSNSNNQVVNIKQWARAVFEKKLNIRIIQRETNFYSAVASVQTVLEYYGIQLSQNAIYNEIGGTRFEEIGWSEDNINWINHRLAEHNVNTIYSRTYIPSGFGQSNSDLFLCQNYVISSLHQNVPIIFSFHSQGAESRQTVVIYGVEVHDEVDPTQTLYHISRPSGRNESARNTTLRGEDLHNFFSSRNGAYFIGASRNFDLENHKINIKPEEKMLACSLQAKTKELNQAVDLTKEVGIINLAQLKKFKKVEISDYSLSTKWFSKVSEKKGENWLTKGFIDGSTPYKQDEKQSWALTYRSVAQGEFTTKYRSSTWLEDDKSFYLNLSYQFYAQALLTTTLIYVKIFLGSKWVLTF